MSNLDPERRYDNMTDLLRFSFSQMMKGIYTCLPGECINYNQSTKRIRVQPSINLIPAEGDPVAHPTVVNVPVVHPSGGGFTLLTPISPGDPVLILFTQRGLTLYKTTFSRSNPDDEGFFSLKDAVVIAGFGALAVTPATSSGITMQTEDGANAVYVEDGHIRVQTPGTVRVDCDSATVNAPNGTVHNGNLRVNGGITWTETAQGDNGGAARFSNGISNEGGDIVSNSISHNSHVHSNPEGGNTGGPQ